MNTSQILTAFAFLVLATTLEVSGDAIVRMGIYNHGGTVRAALFLADAVLLFGYGFSLNLAPVEFRRVVGLYIATLFVVWQIINFIAFRNVTQSAHCSGRNPDRCRRVDRHLLERRRCCGVRPRLLDPRQRYGSLLTQLFGP